MRILELLDKDLEVGRTLSPKAITPVLLLRTGYVLWQKHFANVRPSTRFPQLTRGMSAG